MLIKELLIRLLGVPILLLLPAPIFATDNDLDWTQLQSLIFQEIRDSGLYPGQQNKILPNQLNSTYYVTPGREYSVSLPKYKHKKRKPGEQVTRVMKAGQKSIQLISPIYHFLLSDAKGSPLSAWIEHNRKIFQSEKIDRNYATSLTTLNGDIIVQKKIKTPYKLELKNKTYAGLAGTMLILKASGVAPKLVGKIDLGYMNRFGDIYDLTSVDYPVNIVAGFEIPVNAQKTLKFCLFASTHTFFRNDKPQPTEAIVDSLLERIATIILGQLNQGMRPASIEIKPLQGDLSGSILEDGDVLYHVTDFTDPEYMTFEIKGISQPEEIYIDVENWHRPLFYVSGNSVQETNLGYKIHHAGGLLSLDFGFNPENMRIYRDSFPGGPLMVIPLKFYSKNFEKRFFLQITDWQIVITRFEILQADSESTRSTRVDGDIPEYQYNSYVEEKGKLWDTWQQNLFPLVQPNRQTIQKPIIMGWAKDESSGHTFRTAENSGAQEVPGFDAVAHLVAIFDPEIIIDPKVEPPRSEFGDGLDSPAQQTIKSWEEQVDIWSQFQVDNFWISFHEVGPLGTDIGAAIKDGQNGVFVSSLLRGKNRITDYANHKRWDSIGRQLVYEVTADPHRLGPLRKSGIYEVRLHLHLTLGNNTDNYRKVDVAIRIKVLDSGITVKRIFWNTQRR